MAVAMAWGGGCLLERGGRVGVAWKMKRIGGGRALGYRIGEEGEVMAEVVEGLGKMQVLVVCTALQWREVLKCGCCWCGLLRHKDGEDGEVAACDGKKEKKR